MDGFLSSLLLSSGLFLLLAISLFGWGETLLKAFKLQQNLPVTRVIWLGWAVLLVLLSILHLFLPLQAVFVLPVLVAGVILLIPNLKSRIPKSWLNSKLNLRTLIVLAPAGLFMVWVTLHAMLQPTNYDSGLYHFNTVRWLNTYPIIKGLGNVHGRLAFNQTFFLFDAAMNLSPWFNQGRSIANAFLMILTTGTLLEYLLPVIRHPKKLFSAHPFKYMPSLLILPYLGYLALTSNGLGSPSPDLTSSLLQIVLLILLTAALGDWLAGDRDQTATAFLLAVLAPTMVTVKLSNLAFGLTIYLFVLAYGIRLIRKQQTRQALKILLPLPILIIAIWILRGYLQSGTPFYPSTLGYIQFPWSMDPEWIEGEASWIYSWARLPNVHPDDVLGNWNWLPIWWERVRIVKRDFITPLVTGAGLLLVGVGLTFFRKQKKSILLEWSILLPVAAALIYWFFSAPDIRFIITIFPLFALCGALIVSSQWYSLGNKPSFVRFLPNLLLFGLISWFHLIFIAQNPGMLRKISTHGYYDPPAVALSEHVTESGLVIWMPDYGDQCWDSPLPCTPYYQSNLRLLTPGEPKDGFAVLPD